MLDVLFVVLAWVFLRVLLEDLDDLPATGDRSVLCSRVASQL